MRPDQGRAGNDSRQGKVPRLTHRTLFNLTEYPSSASEKGRGLPAKGRLLAIVWRVFSRTPETEKGADVPSASFGCPLNQGHCCDNATVTSSQYTAAEDGYECAESNSDDLIKIGGARWLSSVIDKRPYATKTKMLANLFGSVSARRQACA